MCLTQTKESTRPRAIHEAIRHPLKTSITNHWVPEGGPIIEIIERQLQVRL